MKKFLLTLGLLFLSLFAIYGCEKEVDLDAALAELTFATTVENNINMPKLSDKFKGVEVIITSDKPGVLSNTGVVKRGLEDVVVKLTVTVKKGDKEATKTVSVTVKGYEINDVLDLALSQITLPAETSTNLTMPKLDVTDTRFAGLTLTFTSDKPAVISNEGVVTQKTQNETVKITAKVAYGETSKTKVLTVVVLARALNDEEKVAAAKAAVSLPESTKVDIMLPDTHSGVNITWASNKADVLSNEGVVNRPYLTDVVVTLTATFKSGSVQETKTYNITVTAFTEEEITVKLTNVSYTLTQVELEKAVNAKLTIQGKAELIPGDHARVVTLILYWKDDTLLAQSANLLTATDGSFKFEINPNDYGIGWDWYKFAIHVAEKDITKMGLVPYADEQKVLAVLKGQDGEVREFITCDNNGYLNVRTNKDGIDPAKITDKMKALADYERLSLPDNLMLKNNDQLPANTGEWGQQIPIVWSTTSTKISITDNKVTVHEDADAGSITLKATITKGDYSVIKEFIAGAIAQKPLASYSNQMAYIAPEQVSETESRVKITITADVSPISTDPLTYQVEMRIDKDGAEEVLLMIDNSSTEDGKLKFEAVISDQDFKNEWAKYRIIAKTETEEFKEDFPDSIVIANQEYVLRIKMTDLKYYEINHAWGFLYTRVVPGDQVREKTSTEIVKLRLDTNKVYLEIEGKLSHLTGYPVVNIKLKLKNIDTPFDNQYVGTDPLCYKFSVDITDIKAGDWNDIHIQFGIGNEFMSIPQSRDLHANSAMVAALNEAYQIEINGFRYKFEEWGDCLKIHRQAIE